MDFSVYDSVCRICLQQNATLNWNDEVLEFCSMSYRECYYKYTHLEDIDSDSFPTNLCELCANGLSNAHSLLEKAVKSFKILLSAHITEKPYTKTSTELIENNSQIKSVEYNVSHEISNTDSPEINTLIKIEEEMYLSEVETAATEENEILQKTVDNTIEPGHFLDIKTYEISEVSLVEKTPFKNCDTKLSNASSKKAASNRKRSNISSENVLKKTVSKTSGTKLLGVMPNVKTRRKTNISESQANTQLDYKPKDNIDVTTTMPSTNNKAGKIRKKLILLCAYCSLKVNGNNELKRHEATHSEDRKRSEICPQCGIKLYTKMALRNHIKIHDVNRQKNYKCEFCEKAFYNRGALNVHRRIHLGQMVPCPICSREFYRQIDLDKHLPTHSVAPLQKNNKKELKYTVHCQYCNDDVPTNKWRAHKAAHLDQPQLKCKICDKNFFARSRCVSHLRRFHKKNKEYEQFIHYYVQYNHRVSHLLIKQQEIVKPLTTTTEE